MINEKMQKAINDQINAEFWSAYLYLAMSVDAESKSFKGLANWFYVQFLEEQDHARIFQNYMNSVGAKVVLQPLAEVPSEWRSPVEMFKDTLSHERKVTGMIVKLVELAIEEKDYATLSRLQWFIDEQVEEEDSALFYLTEFERAGRDFCVIHRLDEEMGGREYAKASALE